MLDETVQAVEVLETTRSYFAENPNRWMKELYHDPFWKRSCLVGGINRFGDVGSSSVSIALSAVRRAIVVRQPAIASQYLMRLCDTEILSIEGWNDHPTTQYHDVLEVLTLAINLLRDSLRQLPVVPVRHFVPEAICATLVEVSDDVSDDVLEAERERELVAV